ncbi:MAG TPA: DNA-3-methyladenine glycosylase 2 family protein, partial [Acidimicrobiia bacterium]|nr:DNA-3-methyladenine glycosylase 2 family protein [Acidimicrobiia bacterium]
MPRVRKELLDAAARLSRWDRALGKVIKSVGPPDIRRGRPRRSHFAELARAVCYQQLAGSAARAIHGRFEELFGGEPTPEAVLAAGPDRLRSVGLSGSKARTISDLAAQVVSGEVELDRVARLSDDEIVRELTGVWGIGRWTAEMFLIFQLGRLDVWPVGDYGVRKGYATAHALADVPSEKELEPLGDPYRPYR